MPPIILSLEVRVTNDGVECQIAEGSLVVIGIAKDVGGAMREGFDRVGADDELGVSFRGAHGR